MIDRARSTRRILLVLTLSVGLHLVVALAAVSTVKYWRPLVASGAESARTLSLALVSVPVEPLAEAPPTTADVAENTVPPTPLPSDLEPAASSLPPPITTDAPTSSTVRDVPPELEPELLDHEPEPVVEPELDMREEFDPIPPLSEVESQPADSELAESGGADSTEEASNADVQAALEDEITSLLRHALAAQLRYPERLRRRQAEGCVTARVEVAMTGAVSLLAITEASRQREFNQEVTRAIGALPNLALDLQMPENPVQLTVPVCFTLTAS
ncbi:MAG: TonB family protein [Natronospirillum sp.]